MKIGIFDSGLGGLIISKAITKKLPSYDYIYLGDTARVPYGHRSQETIYRFTKQAIASLFKQDCQLVIVACNTASANALRRIQKEFLPKSYPDRRVLGVIIPTLEAVGQAHKKIGVIGTSATVKSGIYKKELRKLWPNAQVFQQAAPGLVPLVENNQISEAKNQLRVYLAPLLKKHIDTLVLGCTHYPLLQKPIKELAGQGVKIISQTETVPERLKTYLRRHPEIASLLSTRRQRTFEVTKLNKNFQAVSRRLWGKKIKFKKIKL